MRVLNPIPLVIVLMALGAAGTSYAVDIGPDDRQISFTGPAGSTATDAVSPAIAYDNLNQRYLAVWSADESDGDFLIHGQLLSGAAGAAVGGAFVVGPAGLPDTDHRQPAVAFDDVHQHYLVVWSSDALSPGAYEILGQAVGVDGQLVGPTRRYSDMGTNDADTAFDAVTPDVAWHAGLNAFVVVWAGDDDAGDLSDGRFELYGQLVAGATDTEFGANDFRISFAGPDAAGNDATNPAVAVIPDPLRWYVAFEGDITDDDVHDTEVWMYGGSVDVPDGAATQLSLMGGGYNDGFSARNPDLAWAPSSGELICVWDGDNGGGAPRAIYGQRVLLDGTLSGGMLFLSDLAPPTTGILREAIEPAIAVNPQTDAWFVTWRGDLDDTIIKYDHEIWACRYDDIGAPIDAFSFSLSGMDPSLGPIAGAGAPAVAINATHGYKLVVWSGDLDTTPGGEHEIFAQAWADDGATAVDDTPAAAAFRLHQAVPNPFNPSTKLSFEMAAPGRAHLDVYDAAGRLVATLVDGHRDAGRHDVTWDGWDSAGRPAPAGVYLYRLRAEGVDTSRRMMLVK